jgi:hypothetical protein
MATCVPHVPASSHVASSPNRTANAICRSGIFLRLPPASGMCATVVEADTLEALRGRCGSRGASGVPCPLTARPLLRKGRGPHAPVKSHEHRSSVTGSVAPRVARSTGRCGSGRLGRGEPPDGSGPTARGVRRADSPGERATWHARVDARQDRHRPGDEIPLPVDRRLLFANQCPGGRDDHVPRQYESRLPFPIGHVSSGILWRRRREAYVESRAV